MKILAIDPASYHSGYVVVNEKRKVYTEGAIIAPSKDPLPKRLLYIYRELESLIHDYKPELLAMETPFQGRSYKITAILNQVQGVIMLLATMHGIKIERVTPLQASDSVMKKHKNKKKYSSKKKLYVKKKTLVRKEMCKIYKTKTDDENITDAYSIAEFCIVKYLNEFSTPV